MLYVIRADAPDTVTTPITPTRLRLIGPFDSAATAATWGAAQPNNPAQKPWWRIVDLSDPTVPLVTP